MKQYNNIYTGSSHDVGTSDGIWVYYNGELYHSGRMGMKWGKHLPGTDWWKETVNSYYQQNNIGAKKVKDVDEKGRATFRTSYGNNPNLGQKVKANWYAAKQSAKAYGSLAGNTAKAYRASARVAAKNLGRNIKNRVSYGINKVSRGTSKLWNTAKGYSEEKISKLKESARKAYEPVRGIVNDIMRKYQSSANSSYSKKYISGKDNLNSLRNYVSKEYMDSCMAYTKAQTRGSFGNNVNSFIQTAQYNVVSGCASFLNSIGLDDEVAAFLKKINK